MLPAGNGCTGGAHLLTFVGVTTGLKPAKTRPSNCHSTHAGQCVIVNELAVWRFNFLFVVALRCLETLATVSAVLCVPVKGPVRRCYGRQNRRSCDRRISFDLRNILFAIFFLGLKSKLSDTYIMN